VKLAAAGLLLAALCGCSLIPPAQRGGRARVELGHQTTPPGLSLAPSVAEITPPDNPAAQSTQALERQETRQTIAPALPTVKITETPQPDGRVVRVTEQYAPPAVLTHTVAERSQTALGPAQKDTARTTAATLAAMRPVQLGGLVFLAAALACLHPAVRVALGGGKTLPALAAALGLALVFGPQLFAGRETLVLLLAVAGLLAAWLLSRLSYKEAQADALKTSSPPASG